MKIGLWSCTIIICAEIAMEGEARAQQSCRGEIRQVDGSGSATEGAAGGVESMNVSVAVKSWGVRPGVAGATGTLTVKAFVELFVTYEATVTSGGGQIVKFTQSQNLSVQIGPAASLTSAVRAI